MFSISPNPFTDYVKIISNSEMLLVVLSDMLLRPIYSNAPNSNSHQFSMDNLISGSYLITVTTAEGSFTKRIININ